MKIAIVGSGNMANGIGTRIVAGKHFLTIYDKNADKAKALAKKLGNDVKGEKLADIIEGEVIIFALPYQAILEVIEKYKKQLAGKILVDISNPVNFKTFELLPPDDSSGAEEIAKNLPVGAKLVKSFNTTFAGTLVTGVVDGKKLDVFIAGDDKEAKNVVKQITFDGGLRGIDVGPLNRAKHLEGMMLIQMSLQEKLGTKFMNSIKLLQ